MEISVEELLKGKSTLIKQKEFFPTRNYVEPFLERMSKFTDKFKIEVKTPDQITLDKNTPDVAYNRVLIQAIMPEKYCIDSHDEVYGLVYGIDVKKPVAKFYKAYLNQACTNLTVFSPQWMDTQEIIPGDPLNYNSIKQLMESTSNFETTIKNMKSEVLDRSRQKEYLGEWVDYALREHQDYGYGKVKIAVSTPVDAYKQLFIDQSSNYFIPQGMDPSLYDVYNSFTQIITDDRKDILNKFEKTLLIGKLLKVVN